jgi:hypothetical protein
MMYSGRFNRADRDNTQAAPEPREPKKLGSGCSTEPYVQSRLDASSSLLVTYGQNCTTGSEWSRREKRIYHRAKSGLAKHPGEILRFLTLTSSNEAEEAIGYDFRILKLRIGRLTPNRLVRDGYLRRSDLRRYYQGKPAGEPMRFDYLKVETSEGNGVIHALYFGDYLPQKWLSDQWSDIHQSWHVDIRATKKGVGHSARLARYIVTQYVGTQSKHVRLSWSYGWVFKGFVGVWNALRANLGKFRAIEVWERFLRSGWMDVVGSDPPVHKGLDIGFFEVESDRERIEREFKRSVCTLGTYL